MTVQVPHWLKRSHMTPRSIPGRRPALRRLLEEMEQRVVPVSTLSIGNTTFNLAAGSAGYAVTRSGDLTNAIDVGYTVTNGTAVNGTNYSSNTTGVLHFPSGLTSASIPLTILSNNFPEATRNFTVDLTSVIATFGPPPTFADQQSFAAGSGVRSVATADFNGDGRPDVVTANQSESTISVQLNTTAPGDAAPSFALQTNIATGSSPQSVIAADVNGDGRPDIIVANYNPGTLSVLLNTTAPGAATATFSTQQTFATGADPSSVTAADLNNDGLRDLIATNTGDDTVSVFFNTTAAGALVPTFAAQQTFATGSQPLSVSAADLNGDGLRDLVVANSNGSSVSVLLNATVPGALAPNFATQQTFATDNPLSVTLADVNGDGLTDLITASSLSNTVAVLLNTSSPGSIVLSFSSAQPFATGNAPFQVAAADLNGDGRPDLLVANRVGTVSMLLNTTVPGAITPTFAARQSLAAGNTPYSVAASDLNGDGRPDIIVANKGDGTTSVLLNTTSHTEATPSGVPEPLFPQSAAPATGLGAYSVAAADYNGDGRPDMAVANYADNTVSVLLNTTPPGETTPTFTAGVAFPVGNNPFSVVAGDVNGDGRPDLVVTNRSSSTVSVLLNTTAAGSNIPIFAVQVTFATGSTPTWGSLADVNNDGLLDILVANSISNTVSVLINTTPPGSPVPTFANQLTFSTGTSPRFVAAADVNGDGLLDLLVANNGSNSASVLLNTTVPGSVLPTFSVQQSFAAGSNPLSIAAADINGDGRLDLLLANVNSNNVSVLLNTTIPGAVNPSFAAQQTFATGGQPHIVTAADMNGDGRLDIMVASSAVSKATLLVNTTAPGSTTTSFTAGIHGIGCGRIPVHRHDL